MSANSRSVVTSAAGMSMVVSPQELEPLQLKLASNYNEDEREQFERRLAEM